MELFWIDIPTDRTFGVNLSASGSVCLRAVVWETEEEDGELFQSFAPFS